jgi:hypothetical protein
MTYGRCNVPAAAVRPPGRVTEPTWWGGWGRYYPTLPRRYRPGSTVLGDTKTPVTVKV